MVYTCDHVIGLVIAVRILSLIVLKLDVYVKIIMRCWVIDAQNRNISVHEVMNRVKIQQNEMAILRIEMNHGNIIQIVIICDIVNGVVRMAINLVMIVFLIVILHVEQHQPILIVLSELQVINKHEIQNGLGSVVKMNVKNVEEIYDIMKMQMEISK